MQFRIVVVIVTVAFSAGCAAGPPEFEHAAPIVGDIPLVELSTVGGLTLGEPVAVSVAHEGNLLVADAFLGRIVGIDAKHERAVEFEIPAQSPSFYPVDVRISGFFVYALDVAERKLLRFDRAGSFRDVLISFDDAFEDRSTPVGLDVDGSGRIAITDTKNHVVVIFDNYLQIELAFGNYGTAPGQLDSPEGVSFLKDGGLVVADTGNRRLQIFDSGGAFVRLIPSAGDNPMRGPRRVVTDRSGRFFVADPAAGRVFVFETNGELARVIAPDGVSGFRPTDVAVTSSDILYVADGNGVLYSFR
jgi:DNA-binding beta-propeller fold protein YncE